MKQHSSAVSGQSGYGSAVARVRTFVLAIVLLFAAVNSAPAQYFGQNKVQYKPLDFQVMKTPHFDIYFYPAERQGIDIAARMAERWHARLEQLFRHKLRGRQPLIFYGSHTEFEQNNIVPAIGEGTGGVTEPLRRRIILPLAGTLADTDHVIGHELVHAFQFDMTTEPDAPAGRNGAEALPLWFIEGMAEYLSLGPVDANTAMWMRDAVRQDRLPDINDLNNPKYFPYRWGQAFWAYVGGRWGDGIIPSMLTIGGASGDLDATFKKVLGETTKQVSMDWHAALQSTYAPFIASRTPPAQTGRTVIMAGGANGNLNVGPSISPDGRRIAFLSERGLLSVDLYIADAETGRVLRRLTSTATDPHYSSLQFIYSAGAWDKASTQLAVAAVKDGRAALAIFDAVQGQRTRDIPIAGVDDILNPSWSPDGRAIAFSGMRGGLTDLYVYDLERSMLRRLTSDPFSDLQPAWSPDGSRLAFATDRFSSRLDALAIGEYRLAVMDVSSGRVEEVRTFDTGRSINPQWSADGRFLYFLSDRDGVSNLYRAAIAGGAAAVRQLTNVATGLSGITNSSPALSVASTPGIAAFSVYDKGNYAVHTLALEDVGVPPAQVTQTAALLPPVTRNEDEVAGLLADAAFGLPEPQAFEVVPYKASLALEGVGQPTFGIGASRFGAVIGGGISFAFSDMLNTHYLVAAVQFNSSLGGGFSAKDTGAQVGYLNQSHRWNWGVIAGQTPYLSGSFGSGFDVVNGRVVGVDQTFVLRQTERSASGLLAYPFSRARRVEFQGGVTQISFDQIVQTTTFDPRTGQILDDSTNESSAAPGLTLGTTTAAFVSDTSSFGATSPVAGERYRLEVSPTLGSVNFAGLLADYRRYFMPARFYTLAGRVMHYGRYGSGAEDSRLVPLYLGYPSLVRGYDVNSFRSADCVAAGTDPCPAFSRLLGSRMLVTNVEFRFPLLRPFGVSQRMYGPVPVEVAFFGDAGVAWGQSEHPTFLGGHRDGVTSAGVALRANLFGYAIGELDLVRPFQRPGSGWIVQFNFTPGF